MTIVADGLTKRYGSKYAIHDVSFEIQPGTVTGFLGPNGAGKSTTMRSLVGLDRPTSGQGFIDGRPYRELAAPLRQVGTLLDAKAAHRSRTAYQHLRWIAATHRLPKSRIDEVIGITGLSSVAGKKVGGFSLGMGQRLGLAVALLGDPHTLILDEPVNGLDPDGVIWIRNLLKSLSREGRTVLLSSHLLSELSLIADHVVIIGKGRIIADKPLAELVDQPDRIRVRTTRAVKLMEVLVGEQVTREMTDAGTIEVVGLTSEEIAERASRNGIVLTEIGVVPRSLEDVYRDLTRDQVEYGSNVQGNG
ncbi:ABC transporter ATP-binding protein [Zhihengliuella halotolerans]|uniref:ABC-2 type transport system ATP-binding protein n=1 Tax=Zhihengliuella halotolerans TaxID=370736 RepID=A0A4Q8AA13_9MICC|nr:ATP-binding cassette domain-containing protein [Zhihengliuella halotolerans]RZU60930.1 ABC-2 type transport system ATP-binding protein [Zhihengliuella halotolerans]